jgi:hypothetical protein
MGVPILDARSLQKQNTTRAAELDALREAIVVANEEEDRRYDMAREAVYDGLLRPFSEAFARLKNVDLADLVNLDPIPVLRSLDVELRAVQISVLGALGAMTGGTAVGAGAAAVTFAAVGAFATASTGAAISSLTGAAATSATLAWLGGGSLAAGGGGAVLGTAVLTGVFAVPAVAVVGVVLHVKGCSARREQQTTALELDRWAMDLRIAETTCAAVRERSTQVREVLDRLLAVGRPRVEGLGTLVDRKDDFTRFDPDEVAALGVTLSLVTAAASVMKVPLCDEDGIVTDLSGRMVADADARMRAAEQPVT